MALLMGTALSLSSSFPPVKTQVHYPPHSNINKQFFAPQSSSSIVQIDSIHLDDPHRHRRLSTGSQRRVLPVARSAVIAAAMKTEPLKIMISGAPASGKGTQCELIKEKYGLVHIAAGDLLRAEVAAGTENGKRAKEYMEKGKLVPDEIVVMMVRERLMQSDAQENGWLLDGYPRSLSQAKALEDLGIRPDLFILLDVSEDILVERVVGRRLDPVTGKIYHLKYSPPENEEIAARLTQRFDDTEEKVKLRLQTHHNNVDDVLSVYKDVIYKVNGNAPREDVFAEIDSALSSVLEKKAKLDSSSMAAGTKIIDNNVSPN
ncbi:adenylate kinase, chloroplastic-like isoform X3 [Asparagus officinalis]|uniref:adenylate kinase, chloroplastic-like isoform X3 n=1 Tax=Asparagus officinalis TaxID=4686 RepID=UPI00098E2D2F|nr:adenylate kinase, chloroplastic-like isoform X3 [Asparagus officinalis]